MYVDRPIYIYSGRHHWQWTTPELEYIYIYIDEVSLPREGLRLAHFPKLSTCTYWSYLRAICKSYDYSSTFGLASELSYLQYVLLAAVPLAAET